MDPANDTALTNLLELPDMPPKAGVPTVDGFHYPAGWDSAADVEIKAGQAGRMLPAMRVIGTVGAAAGAFVTGWQIGTIIVKVTHIGPAAPAGLTGPPRWRYCDAVSTCSGSGWSSLTAASPGPAFYLTSDPYGFEYCSPDGPYSSTARNAFHASMGSHKLTTSSDGTCAGSGKTWVTYMSEAQMTDNVAERPMTSGEYSALPAGQKVSTGTYTPPTITSTDVNNARTVIGAPAVGYNGSGQPITSTGTILTEGQVNAQNNLNCAINVTYCAGGVHDPTQDGGALGAPLLSVPSCAGMTYAECVAALHAAGFLGTITHVELSTEGAVLTKPAGAWVETSPAVGTQLPHTAPITVITNPDPAHMPVLVPDPLPHETYPQYLVRLQALGLVGSTTVLTDATLDPDFGPDEVVRVASPGVGTRVLPATTVRVVVNPLTAPAVGGGPPLFTPPSPPGIDFSPLNAAGTAACSSFPFGVPCYVIAAVGGLTSGSDDAPAFDIPLPMSQHLPIDLAAVQPVVDLLRPLFLLMSLVGLVMWLARKSSNNDAADADA